MEELIKRARNLVVLDEVGSNNPLGKELADALEAQQARIAELLSVLKRCYMLDLHNDALLTDVANAISRTDDLGALQELKAGYEARIAALRNPLVNLYALVIGECPALLNEDSGGNAELEMQCNEAVSSTDDMAALSAHDAAVRKAALLEAAEKWRIVNPFVYDELRRMAEGGT